MARSTLGPEADDGTAVLDSFDLVDLARTDLPSFRITRYTGENERVLLCSFAEEDQVLLQNIYRSSLHLYLELQPHYTERAASAEVVARFAKGGHVADLGAWGSQLGVASTARPRDRDLGRLLHDLRGGAFQALLLRLQIVAEFPEMRTGVQTIFFLVRDHLKIMRNCVGDLDPERFGADSLRKDHDARLLVEKWSHAEFHAVRKPVQVHLHCHFEGTLCESCLEFSTLDRIIYNLMNNAARCTSDGAVHFYVLPVPENASENVRFVITNAVTLEHRLRLDTAFAGRPLSDIFNGGFTTGGHGMGLRICADFCAQAYGLPDFELAKAVGYFGARWADQEFAVWFHWPLATH
jgi:signal transduction histidine kinase